MSDTGVPAKFVTVIRRLLPESEDKTIVAVDQLLVGNGEALGDCAFAAMRRSLLEGEDMLLCPRSSNLFSNLIFYSLVLPTMKTAFMIVVAFALAVAEQNAEITKKDKRGAALFGPGGFDYFGLGAGYNQAQWTPGAFGNTIFDPISPDVALAQVQLQATHNVALQTLRETAPGTPTIAYTPEVLKAVQQAKEANHNVIVAQQRVADAKQAAIFQQRVALAKEAAARDAALRSQEITAHAQAEARASARQLVALQQRLASLKDAVAAAQRVAAAREAAAAAAIQRNASETAAELRKQDVDKQISQSEQEAKEKDILAAKQNAVANAVQQSAFRKPAHHPWD
ncbi:treponemal membrane protein B-like [Prorops nasuta]|uniref:treponemal membrane protein B-like n=1 Tax=Prorops nasuta TaxID=863751 RepID=UPI0034CE35A5